MARSVWLHFQVPKFERLILSDHVCGLDLLGKAVFSSPETSEQRKWEGNTMWAVLVMLRGLSCRLSSESWTIDLEEVDECLGMEGSEKNEKWSINGISVDLIVKRHVDSDESEKETKTKHSEM